MTMYEFDEIIKRAAQLMEPDIQEDQEEYVRTILSAFRFYMLLEFATSRQNMVLH